MVGFGNEVGMIEMGTGCEELSMIYKPAVSPNNLGTAEGDYPLTYTSDVGRGGLVRTVATNTTGFSTGVPSSVLLGAGGSALSTVILYEYADTSLLAGIAATAYDGDGDAQNPDGRAQAYMELYTNTIHNTLQRSDISYTINGTFYGSRTEFATDVDRSFESASSALRPNARYWKVSSGGRVKYYIDDGATLHLDQAGAIFFDADGFYFHLEGMGTGDQPWLNGARGMGAWRTNCSAGFSSADFGRLRAEYDAAG
jgi:hypothetical protein